MSPRKERRRRRDWRSSWGRWVTLTSGWLALAAAMTGLVLFAGTGRPEALAGAAAAAVVAVASSSVMPEPRLKRRVAFAPLEGLRVARRPKSLLRQLLTLP